MIIVNIGDELLIGQVVNTNASYMASRFNTIGLGVNEFRVISDHEDAIRKTIEDGFEKTDCLVFSGGLGPTKDDLTKQVICDYFGTELIEDSQALALITKILGERGMEVSESNRAQALVPANSTVLPNHNGTAQGIWIERDGKLLIALPGVPFEMKRMMEEEVLPRMVERSKTEHFIIHSVVQMTDIAESTLSDLLSSWEDALPAHIKLAYLPRPGIVRLRLTGQGNDKGLLEKEIQNEVDKLTAIAGKYIWSYEDNQLEEVVGNLLRKRHKTLALAESCTGGKIAHLITSVAGSSHYFRGSMVAYSNEIKREILNVREQNIKKHGAVSESVVSDMAINTMDLFDSDYCIATSGIAGPDGGSDEKPVGTVWIAVASNTRLTTRLFHFGSVGGREHIIQRAAIAALNMLRVDLMVDQLRIKN